MKKTYKNYLLLVILLASITRGTAQDWQLNGNSPNAINFLGTRNTESLKLKTERNQPINFYTNSNSGAGTLNNQRMTIFQGINANGVNNQTHVGIHLNPAFAITNPVSMLHIGEATNFGSRPWMNVGTTYTETADLMYVGIKNEGSDLGNAVISWADNSGPGIGPDVLRFIFTSGMGPYGNAGGTNGAEIARMSGNGNTGFGNFYAYGTGGIPHRRVEILDNDPNSAGNVNTNQPQLRLTYTHNNLNPNFGVWTDFQTTSAGHLFIDPRSNSTSRNVGISTSTPGNKLEINSNSTYTAGAVGFSGLRFTDLKSGSLPQANPGVGVLSINALGDVIYVPGGGASTANNGVLNNNGIFQLGGPCTDAAQITASQLTTSRALNLNAYNFEYRNGRVGFGTNGCAVNNRVEITGLGANQSGLRFTNLTSASPVTTPNPGIGVLSVNASGDVIYVPGNTGNVNACAAAQQNFHTKWTSAATREICNSIAMDNGTNMGISTTTPDRRLDIMDNGAIGGPFGFYVGRPQLRLTQTDNRVFTDMQTHRTGHLLINPRTNNNMRFVGINLSGAPFAADDLPTQTLDVNGNARLRNTPDGTGQYLMTGVKQGLNTNDIVFNKLAFPNDNTQVLLGDGTWGTAGSDGNKFVTDITVNNATGSPKNITLEFNDGTTITSNDFDDNTGGGGSTVTADNGLTINPANNVQFGQVSTGTGALNGGQLLHDTEVPLDGFNLNFPGIGIQGKNLFFIGKNTSPYLTKFYLYNDTEESSGIFTNESGSTYEYPTGVFGETINFSKSASNGYGVYGYSSPLLGALKTGAYGVYGYGNSGTNVTVGVGALAQGISGSRTYGVESFSNSSGGQNYGVRTIATGGTQTVGIWAEASGGSAYTYAGYFVGDVAITGSVGPPSDENLKENIKNIDSATSILMQMQPKTFNFKKSEYPAMGLSDGIQYGLIAQEVETVLPELVQENIHPAKYDSAGNIIEAAIEYKSLSYTELIPFLIKGFQEQQAQIDSLKTVNNQLVNQQQINDSIFNMLAQMQNCLNNLPPGMGCSSARKAGSNNETGAAFANAPSTVKEVELSNRNNIVLNQNSPNPFKEQTTIAYFIPENVTYAQIVFTDNLGRIIKTVDINEQGHGQLNVFANDLSSGIYTYSIMVDGVAVDTKKMVRTK